MCRNFLFYRYVNGHAKAHYDDQQPQHCICMDCDNLSVYWYVMSACMYVFLRSTLVDKNHDSVEVINVSWFLLIFIFGVMICWFYSTILFKFLIASITQKRFCVTSKGSIMVLLMKYVLNDKATTHSNFETDCYVLFAIVMYVFPCSFAVSD